MGVIYGRGNNAAIRRVVRNGKSLTIGIPPTFLRALNLTRNDFVHLRLTRGETYFTVRRADAFIPERRDLAGRSSTLLAYRKVVKNGNGRMFSLPAVFQSELNLFTGDEVLLAIEHDRLSFTVRAWKPRAIGPAEPARKMGIGEVRE